MLATSAKLRVVMGVDLAMSAADFAFPVHQDVARALQSPEVQGVVLCTPHTQHAEQIVRAAEAGKHVFCEKPLSLSRADVVRAVDACNRNGVTLAVGHEKHFEPPILELMRLTRTGALGTPLQIEANFSQDKFLALPRDNWRLSGS